MPGTISNFHLQVAAASEIADDDEILIYDTSAGTAKTITPALLREETGGVVTSTATQITITSATHAGKTLVVNSTASTAITLPAASGTGNRYRIVIGVSATGTAHTIKCVGTDDMESMLAIHDTSATDITCIAYAATATDDTITLNGTTQSGARGTVIDLEDVATGLWAGQVRGPATGTYATPFSATV